MLFRSRERERERERSKPKALPFLATSISSSVQREVSPLSTAAPGKSHGQKRESGFISSGGKEREKTRLLLGYSLLTDANLIICLHSGAAETCPTLALFPPLSLFLSLSSRLLPVSRAPSLVFVPSPLSLSLFLPPSVSDRKSTRLNSSH